jgi:hypothetical protein
MSKINVILMRKNKTLEIKKVPIIDNKIYLYDSEYIFLPEKQYIYSKAFIKKYFLIYQEGNPLPLDIEKLQDNIILQTLLKSHVISEWLKDTSTNWIWYLLFMIFGVAIGIIIGLGIYLSRVILIVFAI